MGVVGGQAKTIMYGVREQTCRRGAGGSKPLRPPLHHHTPCQYCTWASTVLHSGRAVRALSTALSMGGY
eukprot:3933238-Rhodomonas_salina.7